MAMAMGAGESGEKSPTPPNIKAAMVDNEVISRRLILPAVIDAGDGHHAAPSRFCRCYSRNGVLEHQGPPGENTKTRHSHFVALGVGLAPSHFIFSNCLLDRRCPNRRETEGQTIRTKASSIIQMRVKL